MSEAWKRWEGQVVGGVFPLLRYVGSSGHSAVFLTVRSAASSEKFAIKLIAADPRDADNQLLRWKESAGLVHPNLIRLFESGRCQLEGTPLLYVVMECAEEDLSQVLPERALSAAEAREMLLPVLKTLSYIHQSCFVHGRIKPSNVMAAGDQVKLSGDTLRKAGEQVVEPGPRKISDPPEKASGRLSPAADVWSLGVTLFEVLTQRLPAWDRGQQMPLALPAGITEPFQEIIAHCLKSDPQQRWTIAGIAAKLQGRTPAPEQKAVRPSPPVGQSERKSHASAYIAAFAVAGVIGWYLLGRTKTSDSAHPAEPVQTQTAQTQPAPVPAEKSPDTPAPKPSPAKRGRSSSAADEAPGVITRGTVAHQVLPAVSPSARDTIEGKIRVRVRVDVDPSGNVTDARFESRGPSKYFARLALEAAKGWKFTPAQVRGQPVPSSWSLRFGFRRTDTEAVPTQVSP